MDYIGVSLAGSRTEIGKAVISIMKQLGGVKESTIIGDGGKIPSVNAAYVNGALAHVHELDDGHRYSMGHPGAPIISAILAIGERVDASGKEIIEAIVAGYEVFIRLGTAINPAHFKRGFHTTATCGTLGAAAAAGKLLGLEVDRLVNALGIAATQASGLMEVTQGESTIKPLQPARAAQSGVLSALLSLSGLTAPESILEGEGGFFKAYTDEYDVKKITKGLGVNLKITEVYFKFHASCRHTHPAIDAVLDIRNRHNIAPSEVREVNVRTYSAAYELCGREYEPKTFSTAKFSIPYCVAVALLHGHVGPEAFTPDNLSNKEILSLARKVKVLPDPDLDKLVPRERGARVRIILTNGRAFEAFVSNPYGEPENPPTTEDLLRKFRALAATVLDQQDIDEVLNLLNTLESVSSIRVVADRLYK